MRYTVSLEYKVLGLLTLDTKIYMLIHESRNIHVDTRIQSPSRAAVAVFGRYFDHLTRQCAGCRLRGARGFSCACSPWFGCTLGSHYRPASAMQSLEVL